MFARPFIYCVLQLSRITSPHKAYANSQSAVRVTVCMQQMLMAKGQAQNFVLYSSVVMMVNLETG